MASVYTSYLRQLEQQFPWIVLTVLAVFTILLQPTLSARFFSLKQDHQLETFLETTQATGKIDYKAFWQLRQQYSPGYFTINETAVTHGQTYVLAHLPESYTPILWYHSPRITSEDAIADAGSISLKEATEPNEVLLATPEAVITKNTAARTIELEFVATIEEMQQANGFFDYTPDEQKLLENKVWVNKTSIKY